MKGRTVLALAAWLLTLCACAVIVWRTPVIADLSAFIGSGDVSFAVVTTGGSSYSGTGAAVVEFHQVAGANVSIQYNYSQTSVSSVPEPESYALLLAGLAAIGVVKRRRRD